MNNSRKEWLRDGKFHREDGPAVIRPDGSQFWYRDDNLHHRLDGPAIIRADGTQEWLQNGLHHRLDGPAIIRPDGYLTWYRDGKRHRGDGPAVMWHDGSEEWWLEGELITRPMLTKMSPTVVSVFGPMVENYQDFGGIREGMEITFPTEEDCLLWYLRNKS